MSRNCKIMLVDDDEDDRTLFMDAVQEIDPTISCTCAHDGDEAIRMLQNAGSDLPDFIFLDLNMPRINGKQCLTEIYRRPELRRIPVIIYSTTRRAEDVEETRQLGAVHFLTKPILFSDICKEIRNVIETNWSASEMLNPA